jgi:hypothetical protein
VEQGPDADRDQQRNPRRSHQNDVLRGDGSRSPW